jgi:hypothetical protein
MSIIAQLDLSSAQRHFWRKEKKMKNRRDMLKGLFGLGAMLALGGTVMASPSRDRMRERRKVDFDEEVAEALAQVNSALEADDSGAHDAARQLMLDAQDTLEELLAADREGRVRRHKPPKGVKFTPPNPAQALVYVQNALSSHDAGDYAAVHQWLVFAFGALTYHAVL